MTSPRSRNQLGTGVVRARILSRARSLILIGEIPATEDPRRELVNWIRSKDNPYFARMLVNRYWKHFFGRGLVEPEDDIRPTNPATHPELLEGLARHFIESGFDAKELIRTICNSKAYQLQSIPAGNNGEDQQNFARYYPRRLSAEGLLDAINDVTRTSLAELPRIWEQLIDGVEAYW